MFVGDINNGAIYRFELNENRSALVLEGALADTVANTPQESQAAVFGTDFGGVTDIKAGPDGSLYVVSFGRGEIYRISSIGDEPAPGDDDDADDDTELTVRSADLDGDEITGMFAVIRDSDGDVLEEGFTPLTFEGEEGSTYVVTASDFEEREFERWDDGSTDREREVTLEDDDTTITAHYQTGPDGDINNTTIVERLVRLADGDGCFDEGDRRRLGSAITDLIQDILGEDEVNTDALDSAIDSIVEDCNGNNGGNSGQGNNNGNGQGNGNDDEGDD
jgi:hypothetical protein